MQAAMIKLKKVLHNLYIIATTVPYTWFRICFCQGKFSRTISLNTNYLILFKNPRDNNQISVLARQMYPGNTKFFYGML